MNSQTFFAPRGSFPLPKDTAPYQSRKRPIVVDTASDIPSAKQPKVEAKVPTTRKNADSSERKRFIHKAKPSWMGEARDPPKHGEKTIPQGDPNCLEGKAFVVAGLSTYLTQQEISDLIYDHGGIERTAVSGKTDYLVAGFEMEDGRKISEGAQYKAAKTKKVKIISDEELIKMIEDSVKTSEKK